MFIPTRAISYSPAASLSVYSFLSAATEKGAATISVAMPSSSSCSAMAAAAFLRVLSVESFTSIFRLISVRDIPFFSSLPSSSLSVHPASANSSSAFTVL